MGQYDFTYEFPSDFDGRVVQLLQQELSGSQVASAFQRCHYEYDDKGLAFYADMKGGDYWNKHALDFTLEGTKKDIELLKNKQKVLREALAGALRTGISGFVVRKILFLHNEISLVPTSDEQRISADLSAANSVLDDLIRIGERVCSNVTYRKNSSEYLTHESVDKFNIKVVPDNTVLLSFKLTVGRVAITDGAMVTNEAIAHFKTDKPEINEYLYCYLKDFNYQTMGSTSSIATAVNSKIIKAMPFVIPTDAELVSFHSATAPMFEMIKTRQRETTRLAELRDSLLPKLMSGEIDVSAVQL